jgi:hypothetical protein
MHNWIKQLQSREAVSGTTSMARRRRIAEIIGEPATGWGIATGQRMATYILATVEDWPGDRSDEEVEALGRATEASTLDTLVALYTGDHTELARSAEPVDNIAFYVSRGIPMEEVLRNVHAGQEFLTQELVEVIETVVTDDELLPVIKEATRDLISAWSYFTHRVTLQYARERERWASDVESAKADIVRRLLAGHRDAPDDAANRLVYSLDQPHTALVLWLAGLDHETTRMFGFPAMAEEIAKACGSPVPPLVVTNRGTGAHVWLGNCDRPVAPTLHKHLRLPAPLRIAVGVTALGLTGFRLSHTQAEAARRVARMSEQDDQITDYSDVDLVALLTSDMNQARAFVRSTLGPLCRQDTKSAELRRTLMAWIGTSGSIAGTAAALFTHRNTVSYRLRQIDELLGTNRDSTRVRCALEIAARMPGIVLAER